ncbi:MAG: prepilin-type N-terminal cleavage/methylation domain-containing protein [Gemmatimonadetes bacterium]|nr:prepilin-type N-terminal cleavage/methylation domain-containing protein [Gemmatimonadota bacterium]
MGPEIRRGEGGVTLVEVLVALGILSIVLVALGGLMFQVSLQTRRSAALSYRSAAAQKAQAYVEGLPWDSLGAAVGCGTDSAGQLIYSRCLTIQTLAANLKRLTVVITSTGNLTAPPETLVVSRTKPQLPFPVTP